MSAALQWLLRAAALGWSAALLWGRWLADVGPDGPWGAVLIVTLTLAIFAGLILWYVLDTLLGAAGWVLTAGIGAGGRLAAHARSESGQWAGSGVDWFVAAAREGLADHDAPPWVRGALPAAAVWAEPLLSDGVVIGVDVAEAELVRRLAIWRRRLRIVRLVIAVPVAAGAWGVPIIGLVRSWLLPALAP